MTRNVAKYQQVVEWIRQCLDTGKLQTGDKLESENEIGLRFGISRQTVRHALSILEREGIIESRQGSGNYVLPVKEVSESSPRKNMNSKTAVVVSTYVNGYIFPKIIQGMEKVLEKENWKIRITFTHNRYETERKVLTQLIEDEDVDGLIIEPARTGLPSPNLEYYRKLQERGIPIVFFHSYFREMDIPHVSIDDKRAGYLAAEHLIEQGHRKIAGIFKLDDGQGQRRFSGYMQALSEYGMKIRNQQIVWLDTEEEQDMAASKERIFRRLRGCTGCVCYNDEVANHLIELCGEAGIRVPEDLSLVSIDNSDLARLGSVLLTSVVHPMEALGQKAALNMLELVKNPKFDATYEFTPDIEVRDSVLPRK